MLASLEESASNISPYQPEVLTLSWAPHGAQDSQFYFRHPIQQSMNVAIGAICWLGLTVVSVSYVKRMYLAQKSKKRWCAKQLPQRCMLVDHIGCP